MSAGDVIERARELLARSRAIREGTKHFTDPSFEHASMALCERAEDAELDDGVHTFTTVRDRVTCRTCREWLHA